VNFDFAWRFSLGEHGIPPHNVSQCTYEKGVNYGTGALWSGNVASEKECCAQCASRVDCVAWDFVIPGTSDAQEHGSVNCYIKDNGDTKVKNPARISGTFPSPSPGPAVEPAQSKAGYDDSKWAIVDAPHDMLINGEYSQKNSNKQAFLARGKGWYRKHFAVPTEWKGDAVWIYFEGVFHETTLWLNGKKLGFHPQGYTSFWYRLDDHGVRYGDGKGDENVLAIYVDASTGTGWWYEGGGLTRHHYLVRAPSVFMPPHGSWVHADMTGAVISDSGKAPADGLSARGVVFTAEATVRNGQTTPVDGIVLSVDFHGACESVTSKPGLTLAPGAEHTFVVTSKCSKAVQLWSVARPLMHTATLSVGTTSQQWDSQNVSFGARAIRFDADTGFYLNGKKTKMRGFCDHSNFGGVGAAVPDRVNLFRTQALRAVGGNAWRMAHNDPIPIRLDIMDRLGMIAMDENRDYGGNHGQGGSTEEDMTQEVKDMADLVRRDRSHPSVVIWSFCNEVGCNNESAAADFRKVTYEFDGTRPVTQNHLGKGTHPLSMLSLDVQGMSHKHGDVMDTFHKANPKKPIVSSECCSCLSQRGVDHDFCPKPKDGGDDKCHDSVGHGGSDGVFYNNEIAQCTASQVAYSDSRDFNAGTFVWSGFDYLGESRGWPQTGKARGTVADLAGFAKESRWWLRSWWFSNISEADHGKPILWPEASHLDAPGPTVYIPESWVPVPHNDTRTLHVYTNAPSVSLSVNGKRFGEQAVPFFGFATFTGVPYEAGTVTAEALDINGKSLSGSHYTISTPGLAKSIRLSLDAPSPITGTGSALVADGEDVAMVRAELLDEHGNLVSQGASAFSKVTFSVVSGGGRVLAMHSGSPADQHPQQGDNLQAYHGLARAFIRSSEDHASSAQHRSLLRRIDKDGGKDASTTVSSADSIPDGLPPIIVRASVDGLPAVQLSIPLTRDLNQLPLAVAAANGKDALDSKLLEAFV
jgi:hypothetical protein